MPNRHELRIYDYVNRPYEAVRDVLLANPLETFRRATRSVAGDAELRARVGAVDVGGEIDVAIVAIDNARSPSDRPATNLVIAWQATHRSGMFPTMRATLSIYALTPTETQLEFCGTYDPPLGAIGDVVDAIAMRRIATESVTGFVRDVARFLSSNSSSGAAA